MKKINEYINEQIRNDFCVDVNFCAICKVLSLFQKRIFYWAGEEGARRPLYNTSFMDQGVFWSFAMG